MKLALYLLLLQLTFIPSVFASMEDLDNKEYVHCTFFKQGGGLQYVVQDLIEEISHRSKLSFRNVNAPIKRCIQMMLVGEVDFMLSVRVDKDTSKNMDFVFVSDKLSKINFYTLRSDGNWLNSYSDLQGKIVGTMSGLAYFDKFDFDDSVQKLKVNKTKQLSKILEAGRVKAYVTYSGLAYVDEADPTIVKAPYFHNVKMAVLGIYKNSALQSHRSLLEDTVSSIVEDGTLAKIQHKHMAQFQVANEAQ